MKSIAECVAGHDHVHSLWFVYIDKQLSGCTIRTPEGIEDITANTWFDDHFQTFETTPQHVQKARDVLPYLAHMAGTLAVNAMRDFNVPELALAFAYSHSWQLINGAKILPGLGELAKTYAGTHAVYLFRSRKERLDALKLLRT